MITDQFRKRNRLPLIEYQGQKVYSLTICTDGRKDHFVDKDVVAYCFDVLKSEALAAKADVYAYCFMPDHLHLLLGSDDDSFDLIDFIKRFKQQTGFWYRRRDRGSLKASPTTSAGLWQKSYYDHVVRTDEGLRSIAEYVLGNPVRAGLSEAIGEFPFAGSLVWDDLCSPFSSKQVP